MPWPLALSTVPGALQLPRIRDWAGAINAQGTCFLCILRPSRPCLTAATRFLTSQMHPGCRLRASSIALILHPFALPRAAALSHPISEETGKKANLERSGLSLALRRPKERQSHPPSALQSPESPASRPHPPLPAPPAHLLVRVHVDVALDALLPHVGPGVPAHPLSLALGTLVLAEAALLALVWGQTLAFGACLEDRKQTQGVGVHQAKMLPLGSPSSALIPCVPMCKHSVPSPENTRVTPEHTRESKAGGRGERTEEVVGGGGHIFFS